MCFLVQTTALNEYPANFLHAFARCVSTLGIRRLSPLLLNSFKTFLQDFIPQEEHNVDDLIVLFEFTKVLGSCWNWFSKTPHRTVILTVPKHCTQEVSGTITTIFSNEFDLYSPGLFATYDNLYFWIDHII